MQTKYILTFDGIERDLGDGSGSIKNWADVECCLKRNAHDGIVRSFTSDFEFVGDVADELWRYYLAEGVDALAEIAVLTLGNEWQYVEAFRSSLDFSSIEHTETTVAIKSVDNSLAAMIKARKGTKYEIAVGVDGGVAIGANLAYDRIEMLNYVEHTVTGRETLDGDGGWVVAKLFDYGNGSFNADRIETYQIGEAETYERSPFIYGDETIDDDTFIIEAERDVNALRVHAEIYTDFAAVNTKIDCTGEYCVPEVMELFIARCNESNQYSGLDRVTKRVAMIDAATIAARTDFGTVDGAENMPAPRANSCVTVRNADGTTQDFFTPVSSSLQISWEPGPKGRYKWVSDIEIENVEAGQKLLLLGRINMATLDFGKFELTEKGGEGCRQCYFPMRGFLKSNWDSRGEVVDISAIRPADALKSIIDKLVTDTAHPSGLSVDVHISNYDPLLADTWLLPAECIRNIPQAKLYSSFNDFCEWMQTVFGYVYYLGEEVDGRQDLYFVHRSELFNAAAEIVDIPHATDVKYHVDGNLIHSTVEIGYNKQDYGKVCGRDEWNFTNVYTTGTNISDKKLTLKSPYRADCYGIEFLAQERREANKDNKSDNGVFFVRCNPRNGNGDLTINRSDMMEGVRSASVFNGAYSPLHCLTANGAYIASMRTPLTLEFASSDGNSNARCNMRPICGRTTIGTQLFTAGIVEFTTEFEIPADYNCLVRVTDGGTTYTGYIAEVSSRYGREEAYNYKLIVKTIE